MLVCPQCQFENPDTHKFCQKCGVSLTEVICPSCEAAVPSNVEQCPYCGTQTGVVLQAFVLALADQDKRLPIESLGQAIVGDKSIDNLASSTVTAVYLDAQKRYQLLTSLPDLTVVTEDVEIKVLDCQPYQPTLLETLRGQQSDLLEHFVGSETRSPAPLSPSSPSSPEATNADKELLALPSPIQSYLALQPQFHPALPQIHDAWELDGRVVLLLDDRSMLPLLAEVWGGEDVLPLQILHWLYQMTELWGLLEPQQCRQSLLELKNLRVDEDQLLCIQRLYVEKTDPPLTLKDLGRLWQLLFQMSQRTQIGSLSKLCYALETEAITSLEQLRSQFEAIANELQPDLTPPTSTPTPSLPLTRIPVELDDTDRTLDLSPGIQLEPGLQPTYSSAGANFSTSPPRLELGTLDEDMGTEGDDVPTVVLPMKLISIEDAGRSDVGRQRDHNEDCFSIQSDVRKSESLSERTLHAKGLYILCDGMGGHAGGEIASALAVDTLKQYFKAQWHDQLPNEESIREAIYLANKAIYDLNQQNDRSGSGRMGTTVVLVLLQDTHAAIAHVGDSRLYRFSRRRGLEQITIDHEVGQREIQRGVEPAIAYARPDAYQLTQALGPRDENFVSPDIQFMEINEDMLLLLCSDGLTDNDLLETHWRTHLEPLLNTQNSLEQGVSQLIDLANQHNGHDNISAVVIRSKVRPNLEQVKRT